MGAVSPERPVSPERADFAEEPKFRVRVRHSPSTVTVYQAYRP
ncbi:hypothetical protein [Streptomyces lutosisoli]|uniref:Uncharacterized protein n=1 Tax=Streptomyces lutosisoli TaxID=2665721 RepID=A0ABW2VSV4_9ACTN